MTLPWLRFLFVLGLCTITPVAVSVVSGTPLLAASPNRSLTIQNWACPVAYAGADYAADCQEPVANLEFAITAPESQAQTATTDLTGAVTFSDLPPGTYEVTGGPPGEFVQNAIACHRTGDEAIPLPYFPRDNRAIGVTLTDTVITCHWYSVPEDLRGDG